MIKISTMSGKLKGIPAINTDTTSNPFCSKMQKKDNICKDCYSQRMLSTFRKNCIPSFKHNSEELSKDIIKEIPAINSRVFRFHGHGELINHTHYLNFLRIARHNPMTTFTLWTKRVDLVRLYKMMKPENLILIYSNPSMKRIMKSKVGFDKVFNVISKESKTKDNCIGKCADCMVCYDINDTQTCIVERIK